MRPFAWLLVVVCATLAASTAIDETLTQRRFERLVYCYRAAYLDVCSLAEADRTVEAARNFASRCPMLSCDDLSHGLTDLVTRYYTWDDLSYEHPVTHMRILEAAPLLAPWLLENPQTRDPAAGRDEKAVAALNHVNEVTGRTPLHALVDHGFHPHLLQRTHFDFANPRIGKFSTFDVAMSAFLKTGATPRSVDACEGCTLVDIVVERQPACAFNRDHIDQVLRPLLKAGLNGTIAMFNHRNSPNAIRTLVYAGVAPPAGLLYTLVERHGANALHKLSDAAPEVAVARDEDGDCVADAVALAKANGTEPPANIETLEDAIELLDLRFSINVIAKHTSVEERMLCVKMAVENADDAALYLMLV